MGCKLTSFEVINLEHKIKIVIIDMNIFKIRTTAVNAQISKQFENVCLYQEMSGNYMSC